ncbi:bone morphogenetic protein 1-like, partial [Arapaima gigas]
MARRSVQNLLLGRAHGNTVRVRSYHFHPRPQPHTPSRFHRRPPLSSASATSDPRAKRPACLSAGVDSGSSSLSKRSRFRIRVSPIWGRDGICAPTRLVSRPFGRGQQLRPHDPPGAVSRGRGQDEEELQPTMDIGVSTEVRSPTEPVMHRVARSLGLLALPGLLGLLSCVPVQPPVDTRSREPNDPEEPVGTSEHIDYKDPCKA